MITHIIKTFQSTLPRGERLKATGNFEQLWDISIHAPARGATLPAHRPFLFVLISIHAPARGATKITLNFAVAGYISIHAPARGATHIHCTNTFCKLNFNPRSREGSDGISSHGSEWKRISIHAPARGATIY